MLGECGLLLDGVAREGVDVDAVVLGSHGNLRCISRDGDGRGLVFGVLLSNNLLTRDDDDGVEGDNNSQVLAIGNRHSLGLRVEFDSVLGIYMTSQSPFPQQTILWK